MTHARIVSLLKQSDYPRCNPAEWSIIQRNISTAIAALSTDDVRSSGAASAG